MNQKMRLRIQFSIEHLLIRQDENFVCLWLFNRNSFQWLTSTQKKCRYDNLYVTDFRVLSAKIFEIAIYTICRDWSKAQTC